MSSGQGPPRRVPAAFGLARSRGDSGGKIARAFSLLCNLLGSTALVTGGSRGIGLGYAEALAAAGCDVAIMHFQDEG